MLLLAFTAKPNDTRWFPSDGHQHGLSVQNSINLGKKFLQIPISLIKLTRRISLTRRHS